MGNDFEWDEAKATANYAKHGVSFETATEVFRDPFGIERLDDREHYDEERYILTGTAAEGSVLTIVFTERNGIVRIISARQATQLEQDDYFVQNG